VRKQAPATDVRTSEELAVLAHRRLFLSGLHARIGLRATEFVSCAAAIGDMIAEMGRVRERHGKVLGVKGMGEGGAIASPAAVVNAVADALAPLGVRVSGSPLGPRQVLDMVAAADH
jgi:hypothetical protein